MSALIRECVREVKSLMKAHACVSHLVQTACLESVILPQNLIMRSVDANVHMLQNVKQIIFGTINYAHVNLSLVNHVAKWLVHQVRLSIVPHALVYQMNQNLVARDCVKTHKNWIVILALAFLQLVKQDISLI